MKKNVEILKVNCVVYEMDFDEDGYEVGCYPIAFCSCEEQARELINVNLVRKVRYKVGVNESSFVVPDFLEDK